MLKIQGIGVTSGLAGGRLYFYQRPGQLAIHSKDADIEEERARLVEARNLVLQDLEGLVKEYRNPDEDQIVDSAYWHGETPAEMAQLFEAHAMLIEDVGFNATIDQILEERGCNVEYAVSKAADKYIQKLLAMEDDYFKERASDIKDVRDRLLYKLLNRLPGDIATEEPVILVADELMPSEAIHLNQDKVLGIVTKGGSENSHTAMLIRNMGIPYICGIGEDLGDEYQGKQIYINADTGEIIADPDEMTLIKLVRRYDNHQRQRNRLRNLRGKADVTLDGQYVKVYCNINSPEDVDAVRDNDGRGIGLFRSEGLFFAYDHLPDEEEQFEAYRKVAIEMEGAPVIVRTLDAGSDKKAQYLKMENERNPALGMRGVRYSLNNIEIFKTQLRAIYRASAYGEMSVMFPLVTSVWEVEECLKVCQEVQKELEAEDQPFDPDVQKGIMIETPAAIMIADELAQKVDFFSVGINDLTQYILACDRMNNDLDKLFDPHHPAIIKSLKIAAEAAHKAGIWIGVCGELSAQPAFLDLFLSLGIDELSVPPNAVLPLRAAIRRSKVSK